METGSQHGDGLEVLRGHDFWHPLAVYRRGDVLVRETGPWAASVHALLRHLESVGFQGSPRIVGSGFDEAGRETLTFVPGELNHPGQPTIEAAAAIGVMLRELHEATASFHPPAEAAWKKWHGRTIGGPERVIGHCDAAPWNVIVRDDLPIALIDWELAGPVDPMIDLAQACWLNSNLYDDDIAERESLPPLDMRIQQLRAMTDAYSPSKEQRQRLVDLMIEFAVSDTAWQADTACVTPESRDIEPAWALAWRARTAAWLFRNRRRLQSAL